MYLRRSRKVDNIGKSFDHNELIGEYLLPVYKILCNFTTVRTLETTMYFVKHKQTKKKILFELKYSQNE